MAAPSIRMSSTTLEAIKHFHLFTYLTVMRELCVGSVCPSVHIMHDVRRIELKHKYYVARSKLK